MHGLDCQTPLTSLGGLQKQLRGLDIEKKMVENMINPTRNTDVMPGKWIQLSGVWVKKKAKQARMIYALPFLQKKYFTNCY